MPKKSYGQVKQVSMKKMMPPPPVTQLSPAVGGAFKPASYVQQPVPDPADVSGGRGIGPAKEVSGQGVVVDAGDVPNSKP